jgi:hypothetical protein
MLRHLAQDSQIQGRFKGSYEARLLSFLRIFRVNMRFPFLISTTP